jgi:hypothetical protein
MAPRILASKPKLVTFNRGPLVLTVGALAYLSAVTQRSTMGVATLQATDRFQTNASQLASLAFWQILIYAVMQIPVGVLLDRFGPRLLLAFGALVMSVGQVVVAFAPNLPLAVSGRMLVGLGDAFTFISMIRLINGWYSGRQASRLQQWLGNLGQMGQVVSAIPFAFLLHATNWSSSFTIAATVSLILGFATLALVSDDRQKSSVANKPISVRRSARQLLENLRAPSVRMAFWTHFSTQSAGTVFVLLWGFPFLVHGEGVPVPTVAVLLSAFVFIGFGCGVFYGYVCGRWPQHRSTVIITLSTAIAVTWSVVLLVPGRSPLWLLAVLVIVMAAAGPASMIAFDYSKQWVPVERLGTANGFINIGGFIATFSTMLLIGLLIDYSASQTGAGAASQLYSLQNFRFALPVQVFIVAFGVLMFVREARLTKSTLLSSE